MKHTPRKSIFHKILLSLTLVSSSFSAVAVSVTQQSSATVHSSPSTSSKDPRTDVTGSISGTVLSSSGALANICVQAQTMAGVFGGQTSSATDGTYTISGLGLDQYTVWFSDCNNLGNYSGRYYDATQYGTATYQVALPVHVASSAVVSGINVTLSSGSSISGTVTDADGTGIAGICVSAQSSGSGYGGSPTASNGTYTINGVSVGKYTIQFYQCNGGNWATTYYNNTKFGTPLFSNATPVVVNGSSAITSINVSLASGGSITGVVTNQSSGSLSGVCVSAQSSGGSFGSQHISLNGTYTINGLPTGYYVIAFSNCSTGQFETTYFQSSSSGTSQLSNASHVAVTAGNTVSSINVTMTTGASLSGVVVDGANNPLAGICATAQVGGTSFGGQATSKTGTYSISGLPKGSYIVSFNDCTTGKYVSSYYNASLFGTLFSQNAVAITVAAGSSTTLTNIAMQMGGSLSGAVINSPNSPLAGICVSAYSMNGQGNAVTNSDGAYIIEGLSTGDYNVQFTDCNTGQYQTQYYNGNSVGTPSQSLGTTVKVTLGKSTTNINDMLSVGGSITGTVKNATNQPLAGICVSASTSNGGNGAQTNASGYFIITGLSAGGYVVQYTDCTNYTYATNYYNSTTGASQDAQSATSVNVVPGQSQTGINGSLQVGGIISGIVVDGSNHPLAGICVNVSSNQGGYGYQTTDSTGAYSITGLPAGGYVVQFTDCNNNIYETKYYNGTSLGTVSWSYATSVNVALGGSTTNINAKLQVGGTISGTVIDSANHPLAGICVYASSYNGGNGGQTDANGNYVITGLATDKYIVSFSDCLTIPVYVSQLFNNTVSGTSDYWSASRLTVAVGSTVAAINAKLQLGATISGTITNTASAPLENLCVYASSNTGGDGSAQTDANGNYIIRALATGSYIVNFYDCNNPRNYVSQYYNATPTGATDYSSATSYAVTQGTNYTGVNATMVLGATISGTVTDGANHLLAGICVDTSSNTGGGGSAQTDANGNYIIRALATGSYIVNFYDCNNPRNYVSQYYNATPTGATDYSLATSYAVTQGTNYTGVNAIMVVGATISGTVMSATSVHLSNVCVDAQGTNGNGYGSTQTDANGNYTISALAPGSYRVNFYDCNNLRSYVSQFYNATPAGTSLISAATPYAVTAGSTNIGVNATMIIGATITGTVTNSAGAPVADICVNAQATNGNGYGSAQTDVNGNYTLSALDTGNYKVSFNDCSGSRSLITQFYNATPTGTSLSSAATTYAVTVGSTYTGVNVTMVVGATISGKVTNAAGDSLANITVSANSLAGGYSARTDVNGNYTIFTLATGAYSISFTDYSNNRIYAPYVYNTNSSGTAYSVTQGTNYTGVNATMVVGATISGTVTNAAGSPVAKVCVNANSSAGSKSGQTGTNGTYTIIGLATGNYTIQFYDCNNPRTLITQYYNATSTGTTTSSSATPYSVTVGTDYTGVNATMIVGATISGTVTNAAGNPVSQVCVNANSSAGGGSAQTNGSGTYTISGLPTGNFFIQFWDCNRVNVFITQYYNATSTGTTTSSSATPYSVTVGTDYTGVNATMVVGATISGTVTNAAGNPVSQVCVNANSSAGGGSAQTNGSGTYTMSQLPAGSYTIQFSDCFGVNGFITQYYNATSAGTILSSSATPYAVTAGSNYAGINATVTSGASISGSVTNVAGSPVSQVCVNANSSAGSKSGQTGTNGTYTIIGLATGNYTIQFYDCNNPRTLITQYYNATSTGTTTSSSATPYSVTVGTDYTGVNATMIVGATIAGTVTNAAGSPLANVCVSAISTLGNTTTSIGVSTTANGGYSFSSLPTGSYTIQFSDCNNPRTLISQYYNGTSTGATTSSSATPYAVTAGTNYTGVNATMVTGATISGTVTNAAGNPVANICVNANSTTSGVGVRTGTNGTYTISALPTGSYTIQFWDCNGVNGFIAQFYNATSAGTTSYFSATPYAVTAGTNYTGVNATMVVGATISGTVTNAAGNPVANICVNAYSSAGNGGATTAVNGGYTIMLLPTGSYKIQFYNCSSATNYLTQYYNGTLTGTATQSEATNYAVTVANNYTGVNVTLTAGASISGTVTNAAGNPAANICVYANATTGNGYTQTNGSGSYVITGLQSGAYTIYYQNCSSSNNYITQYYNGTVGGTTLSSGAQQFLVTVGTNITGLNATLAAGATISGTVTNAAGSPMANVCISANSTVGSGNSQSGTNGTYTITGLPTGSYTIRYFSCSSAANVVEQYFNNTPSGAATESGSIAVAVNVGTNVVGLNATMATGATITGIVTDASSAPIPGICVWVSSTSGYAGSTVTNGSGTYTITALATGSYTIQFNDCSNLNRFTTQYYNATSAGTTVSSSATGYSVTAGTNYTGVNATLTAV